MQSHAHAPEHAACVPGARVAVGRGNRNACSVCSSSVCSSSCCPLRRAAAPSLAALSWTPSSRRSAANSEPFAGTCPPFLPLLSLPASCEPVCAAASPPPDSQARGRRPAPSLPARRGMRTCGAQALNSPVLMAVSGHPSMTANDYFNTAVSAHVGRRQRGQPRPPLAACVRRWRRAYAARCRHGSKAGGGVARWSVWAVAS